MYRGAPRLPDSLGKIPRTWNLLRCRHSWGCFHTPGATDNTLDLTLLASALFLCCSLSMVYKMTLIRSVLVSFLKQGRDHQSDLHSTAMVYTSALAM